MRSLKAFLLGMREFRLAFTTSQPDDLIESYGAGRDLAHRLTLRRFDECDSHVPVQAGDGRQDIGGHLQAAANAKVAQQADDDTRRLEYIQKRQATISLVPDGRDEHGTRHSFMVGGWHCSVNRDVRAAIDAAMAETQPPVQGNKA